MWDSPAPLLQYGAGSGGELQPVCDQERPHAAGAAHSGAISSPRPASDLTLVPLRHIPTPLWACCTPPDSGAAKHQPANGCPEVRPWLALGSAAAACSGLRPPAKRTSPRSARAERLCAACRLPFPPPSLLPLAAPTLPSCSTMGRSDTLSTSDWTRIVAVAGVGTVLEW